MLFTYFGMAVRFDESKVRPMGRMARGVKGVTLREEEATVLSAVKWSTAMKASWSSVKMALANVPMSKISARPIAAASASARSSPARRNGNVVGALCVTDDDGLVMISASGQTVRIRMRELRVMGRNTQGVKLVNLKEGDHLVAIQKLENSEKEGDVLAETPVPEAGTPVTVPPPAASKDLEPEGEPETENEIDAEEEEDKTE